ncbi:MAG: hypothetical protein M0Z56_09720 [Desulfobacteraceae bacterium]|nr:hypothetical protein [Desulfobacteraceae bacterium]
MAELNILKTDARGRITLPRPFRSESLFEYAIEGNQLTLYPVKTVRKFPAMSDLPKDDLSAEWKAKELKVNQDTRPGIAASSPSEALKHMGK